MATSPPLSPTYFLDENAEAHKVARLLREAGLQCIRLSDAGPGFYKGMDDVEWIPRVAAAGWWAVTFDGRVLRNKVERAVLLHSSLVYIYVKAQSIPSEQSAAALIEAHRSHHLEQRILARERPVIVRVRQSGIVKIDGETVRPDLAVSVG